MNLTDTIVALATAPGNGALAIIRVSGPKAITICNEQFRSERNKDLTQQKTHTLHLGTFVDTDRIIDEVLVSIFTGTKSYSGEPTVEISCHGSNYIQQEILRVLLSKGCRMAEAGEFTLRAFLNGKMALSEAEAVASVIASDSRAAHQIAIQQMRGGFSNEIKALRSKLVDFASLIELELDFAEEDVSFADRTEFQQLITTITQVLKRLIDSFALGNVLKNGIPVAIVGAPNAGKSTLLNALLNEDRAIVSAIAGTTRDSIEDEIALGGIKFRFIDTAGIHETNDTIEGLGIKKTYAKIESAQIVLYLFDAIRFQKNKELIIEEINKFKKSYPKKQFRVLANKIDQLQVTAQQELKRALPEILLLSAKANTGLEQLQELLPAMVHTGDLNDTNTIISNSRHYHALKRAFEEIQKVQEGIHSGISSDLLAIDIRQTLYHLGEITGEVTSDELLGNIFANFCIGK